MSLTKANKIFRAIGYPYVRAASEPYQDEIMYTFIFSKAKDSQQYSLCFTLKDEDSFTEEILERIERTIVLHKKYKEETDESN